MSVGHVDWQRAIGGYAALLFAPATLAHELTHLLFAWPVATDIGIDRWLPPRVWLEYPAGTPLLAIRAANLAPTCVGLVVAGMAALHWPFGQLAFVEAAYLAGSWLAYTAPSADDLEVLG